MVWDGYVPENKAPDVNDPEFSSWINETLCNLGAYVKELHQSEYDLEYTINIVNDHLYHMCKNCSLIQMEAFILNKICLQSGNWFCGVYRWYPALLHVWEEKAKGLKPLPNGHLILGVAIYDVTQIYKEKRNEKAKETLKDSYPLAYKNMKHSPETIKAYKKCVKIIPELIKAYEESVTETLK